MDRRPRPVKRPAAPTVSLKALLGSARQLRAPWLASQDPAPEAYRLFHGISEAPANSVAAELTIDVFGSNQEPPRAWVATTQKLNPQHRSELAQALQDYGFSAGVLIDRSNPRQPQKPQVLFEKSPGMFAQAPHAPSIHAEGPLRFEIRWLETFQSGLFLDHAPLRQWLRSGAFAPGSFDNDARPMNILNTFSFTGSLSLAAAHGLHHRNVDADITSIDLSLPVVEWAKRNAELNAGLYAESPASVKHHWVRGDVFDWLSRFRKKQTSFDLMLLDPPSFSRADGKVWSTTSMLENLIESSLALLKSGGWWMLSVNTEKMLPEEFRQRVEATLARHKWSIVQEHVLPLPPTHPVKKGDSSTQILKSCLFQLERSPRRRPA